MQDGDPVQSLTLLPPELSGKPAREWLQNALAWLTIVPPERRTARLRRLVEGIQSVPGGPERFQRLWANSFLPKLYADAGMPDATSLMREVMARIKRRILPQLEDELDLYAALDAAGLDDQDADWFADLAEEDIAPWRELSAGSPVDFGVAIRLLALRSAAIGLSRSVMQVMPHRYETDSPFFELAEVAGRFTHAGAMPEARQRLQEVVMQCRMSAGVSHARMEEQGVSSDLVFRLDLVIAQLTRIDVLLRVVSGQKDGRELAEMLIRGFADERGLHSLVRNSVNRLARQIVTHTGKSGEHYIAGSQTEWAKMGYGAMGAGALTAFTAMFKYLFAGMALAPLWIGIAHSLNYTLSFVLMQFLGWSLASKMPSMTAAALCDALEKEDGMQSEVKLVAAITRTQTVVTIGNLAGAVPVAVLIDLFIQWKNGNPFLTNEAALHGLTSMHLLRSETIPFAAMTGCFLWISSLFAGWTANWMAVHRFPEALAASRRIRSVAGDDAAQELGHLVKHHLSGVAGYTCLGLMLGLLPFVSVFAGFPVEVRHITLASASLAYDVSALASNRSVPWGELIWAIGGLAATGILNFTVSFALGLWLAVRARNLDTGGRLQLLSILWSEFREHPSRFLWRHEMQAQSEAA